jgi:hypothetical protein
VNLGKREKKEFSEEVKLKCLLWSYRHCCLCGKACGTDIEIAHVNRRERAEENQDNAIPLCYNCHAETGRYNKEHPRGNKYRYEELRRRREQIYEQYTRRLVPPIHYEVTQIIAALPTGIEERRLPDVGFNVVHLGDALPVRVKVENKVLLGERDLGMLKGPYGGETRWNLNPRGGIRGHFSLPQETVESDERIQVNIRVTIIDEYGREHRLLPLGWVYKRDRNSWYLEPAVDPSAFPQKYPPLSP